MSQFIYSRTFMNDHLAQAGAATPTVTKLVSCQVKLFQAGLSPNPDTPVGDFDTAECDFSGYGAVDSVTWNPPVREGAFGAQLLAATVCQFTVDDTVTINSVGGYYLTSGDDTYLIGSRVFDTPISMGNVGSNITLIPAIPTTALQEGEDAVIST